MARKKPYHRDQCHCHIWISGTGVLGSYSPRDWEWGVNSFRPVSPRELLRALSCITFPRRALGAVPPFSARAVRRYSRSGFCVVVCVRGRTRALLGNMVFLGHFGLDDRDQCHIWIFQVRECPRELLWLLSILHGEGFACHVATCHRGIAGSSFICHCIRYDLV